MRLTREEYGTIIDNVADGISPDPELLLKMALDWKDANSRKCDSCDKESPYPLVRLCRDC